MSSRNYATDYVVHAHGPGACSNPRSRDRVASEVRSDVTCKRCLASLAKRDRAFRAKARLGYAKIPLPSGGYYGLDIVLARAAARAIAAEEGRL